MCCCSTIVTPSPQSKNTAHCTAKQTQDRIRLIKKIKKNKEMKRKDSQSVWQFSWIKDHNGGPGCPILKPKRPSKWINTFKCSTGRGKNNPKKTTTTKKHTKQEPIVGTADWQTLCGAWGQMDADTPQHQPCKTFTLRFKLPLMMRRLAAANSLKNNGCAPKEANPEQTFRTSPGFVPHRHTRRTEERNL